MRLSKVMYGSTCADMQVDVMGKCLRSIKHVVGPFSGLSLTATMDNSDMELSPHSRSNSSSSSSTPKPEKPLSDCERRRNAMERLNKQHIMIGGYKNYLDSTRHLKDETGVRNDMEKHLKETMEARDLLKRKNTKYNSDDFVFPSKTARPTTPTKVLEPVEVQNSYDNLDQDPETSVPETIDILAPSPPLPIFLKIKDNYIESN
ncbi:hypothetical protein TNCV_4213451 [Trichonephila clavipes]|nr:hypothetical protein TNCV_4213451 [Trichonephila clavipes]